MSEDAKKEFMDVLLDIRAELSAIRHILEAQGEPAGVVEGDGDTGLPLTQNDSSGRDAVLARLRAENPGLDIR